MSKTVKVEAKRGDVRGTGYIVQIEVWSLFGLIPVWRRESLVRI